MPEVRVQVSHQLTRDIAVVRLREYSRRIQDEHGDQVSELEELWTEDGRGEFSFRVLGFAVSGTTIVHHDSAIVHIQLPFAAIPLRGLIEKEIANRLAMALESAPEDF